MEEKDEKVKVVIPLACKSDSIEEIELTAEPMWDYEPNICMKIGDKEYKVVGRQMQEAIEYLVSTINTL